MRKNFLSVFVTYFLSFAVAIFVVIAVMLAAVGCSTSKICVKSIVSLSNYEDKAEKEIIESLESLAIPGGLPEDFFFSGLDRDQLHKNVLSAIDCAYKRTDYEVSEFPKTLAEDIMAYAEKNGIKSSVDENGLEENVAQLVNHCTEAYGRFTYSTLLKYLGYMGSKTGPWLFVCAVLAAIIAGFLCEVLKRMDKRLFVRHAFNGAALMVIVAPAAVLLSGSVARLGLTSPCLFSLVTWLIYYTLLMPVVIGIIMLLVVNIKLPSKKG